MDPHSEMITKLLSVPEDAAEDEHYNERSGLILLDGPRGPLLARYTMPSTPPDPERFKFMTTYPKNYTTYRRPKPPERAPADIQARARPIERSVDPRMGVTAGAVNNPDSGSAENRRQPSIMHTPNQGANQGLTNLKGMEITEKSTDIRGEDAGVRVADKVYLKGKVEKPSTEQKGVTKESPLRGLLPESILTFPAASMLPDLGKILRLQQYVQVIRQLPQLVVKVIQTGNKLINRG